MKKKTIVINVETTGLNSAEDELLRVTILSDSGKILFDEYIRPTAHKEWPEAEKIHHITPEMVKDSYPILYHTKELNQIIGSADVIVGYNHSFDMAFLAAAGIKSDPKKNYDLMLEFSQLIGEWDETRNQYKWFRIKECADYFGYQWESEYDHDSLEDCKATLYCYKKMIAGETGKGGTANNERFKSAYIAKPQRISRPAIAISAICVLAVGLFALYTNLTSNENGVVRESDISRSKNYTSYKEMKAAKMLDDQNQYVVNNTVPAVEHTGPVHVTFAENAYIDIKYYYDEKRMQEIDITDCYLHPGSVIYVGPPHYHNLFTSKYRLAGFDIKEYEADSSDGRTSYNQGGSLITLAISDLCTEVEIIPRGEFQNRYLNLEAFYYEANGNRRKLSGDWRINDTPYNDHIGINPVLDYNVSYDFSDYADSFYYVGASPEPRFVEDHTVLFSTSKADDEQESFEVEIHKYIRLTIADDAVNTNAFSYNDGVVSKIEIERSGKRETIVFEDGKTIQAEKLKLLKHDDIVYITVESNYQVISANKKLKIDSWNELNGGMTEYSVHIPKDNYEGLQLAVNEKNSSSEPVYIPVIQNAAVSLRYEDKNYEINSNDQKPKGNKKVVLTIMPEEGYYLEGRKLQSDGSYSETMTFDKYEKSIDKLEQELLVRDYIELTLQTDNIGTAIYKLGKQNVEKSVHAKEGEILVLEYKIPKDSKYRIVTDKGKLVEKAKVQIQLQPEMDGKVIAPSDYFTLRER